MSVCFCYFMGCLWHTNNAKNWAKAFGGTINTKYALKSRQYFLKGGNISIFHIEGECRQGLKKLIK